MKEANMSFEKQWSDALDGAEMSPSEHLWTSIDGVLANQQAVVLKRRILIFKWLSAAAVSLMLLALSVLWIQNTNEVQLAENSNVQKIKNQNSKSEIQNSKFKVQNSTVNSALNQNNTGIPSADIANVKQNNALNEDAKSKPKHFDSSSNSIALASLDEDEKDNFKIPLNQQNKEAVQREMGKESKKKDKKTLITKHSFETLISALNPKKLDINTLEIPKPLGKLYAVADPYAIKSIKIEKDESNLWAGVSMASGAFLPSSTSNSDLELAQSIETFEGLQLANIEQSFSNQSLNTGSSISLGIDLRGKVSSNVILSSGIHYLRNNASLGSNLAVKSTDTGDSFALNNADATSKSLQNDINSGKYELDYASSTFNNEFQYLSIPIKAGYMVLNKQFNITINSGFSTNFLLNVSQNIAGGQTSYSQNDSFKNEFNPVYVNFLSSIAFGYTFQKKYFLSVEPTYRQAITDFAKSNSLSENPKDIGVSVGLKYNF